MGRLSRLILGISCCGAAALSCSGKSICASSDPDCFLNALTIQQGNAAVPLQTLDASRLSSSMSSSAPPSVWAVGNHIAGWNGTNWSVYSQPAPDSRLRAVWSFATDDAWAAGDQDTILHWDGKSWSVATAGGGARSFVGLWGASPRDLWAITAAGEAMHYTGTWSPAAPIASTGTLSAIWGFGASDLWAVGANSTGAGTAFHFDGASWKPSTIGASAGLTTIWGSASNDVRAATTGNTLFHWNGSAWSMDAAGSAAVAKLSAPVWLAGTGPDDVWESGSVNFPSFAVLAHDDGTGWTLQPPLYAGAAILRGGSLWAAAKNDVWMVPGDFWHWDGAAWRKVEGPTDTYFSVHGVKPAAGSGSWPPSITNRPPAMTFPRPSSQVAETLSWSDPSGCQPSFCFSLCAPSRKCSASARCTRAVRDGLLNGQVLFELAYTQLPADSAAEFTLQVVPVSAAGCQDPIALLTAGSAGALIGAPVTIDETLVAGGGGSDGGAPGGGACGPTGDCYANWTCNGQSQCAAVLGGPAGSQGPFCGAASCQNWANLYNSNTSCSTQATYAPVPGGATCHTCTPTSCN